MGDPEKKDSSGSVRKGRKAAGDSKEMGLERWREPERRLSA
jgi:hypothetical protein